MKAPSSVGTKHDQKKKIKHTTCKAELGTDSFLKSSEWEWASHSSCKEFCLLDWKTQAQVLPPSEFMTLAGAGPTVSRVELLTNKAYYKQRKIKYSWNSNRYSTVYKRRFSAEQWIQIAARNDLILVVGCRGWGGSPFLFLFLCISLQEQVYIKQRINLHKGIYLSLGKTHTKTWKVKAALITQEGFKAQQFTRIEGFIEKQWFSCVTPGNKPI